MANDGFVLFPMQIILKAPIFFGTREIACDPRDYVITRRALGRSKGILTGRYTANGNLVLFPCAKRVILTAPCSKLSVWKYPRAVSDGGEGKIILR